MGLSQIMEKDFVLLVGILLLQIVVHCSGADSKVNNENLYCWSEFNCFVVYIYWLEVLNVGRIQCEN